MEVSEVKRLPNLEQENSRLKRLFAEAEFDKAALKELVGGRWRWAAEHLNSRRFREPRALPPGRFQPIGSLYKRKGEADERLRSRLKALTEKYPRYGCSTLHDMLRAEDSVVNAKRT